MHLYQSGIIMSKTFSSKLLKLAILSVLLSQTNINASSVRRRSRRLHDAPLLVINPSIKIPSTRHIRSISNLRKVTQRNSFTSPPIPVQDILETSTDPEDNNLVDTTSLWALCLLCRSNILSLETIPCESGQTFSSVSKKCVHRVDQWNHRFIG